MIALAAEGILIADPHFLVLLRPMRRGAGGNRGAELGGTLWTELGGNHGGRRRAGTWEAELGGDSGSGAGGKLGGAEQR